MKTKYVCFRLICCPDFFASVAALITVKVSIDVIPQRNNSGLCKPSPTVYRHNYNSSISKTFSAFRNVNSFANHIYLHSASTQEQQQSAFLKVVKLSLL